MEECPHCGTVLSGAEDSCFGCGESLDGTAESESRRETDSVSRSKSNLVSNLIAAGRYAMPFVRTPDVDGRFTSQRVEDGVLDYAMFLPLTRGYLAIALGVIGMLVGGFATFVVGDVLAGLNVVSNPDGVHGDFPMPWRPMTILAVMASPLLDGSTEAAIGASVRAGCILAGFIPSMGYTFRLVRAGGRGETSRPFVTDYLGLIGDGIRAYGVVTVMLVGAQLLSFALSRTTSGVATPLDILGLVILVVTYYLLPAILVLYAASGSLLTAFSPRLLFDFAARSRYAGAYLMFVVSAAVIFVSILAVGFALSLTIVGLIIGVPLAFTAPIYVQYFGGTFWGATYYNAAADDEVPSAQTLSEQRLTENGSADGADQESAS